MIPLQNAHVLCLWCQLGKKVLHLRQFVEKPQTDVFNTMPGVFLSDYSDMLDTCA